MTRAILLLALFFAVPSHAAETVWLRDTAGRALGRVPLESNSLDRVGVAASHRASLAVVEHGREGGATLYLADAQGVRPLVRTAADESLTLPAWAPDAAGFALVRTSAPRWLEGPGTPRLQVRGALVLGDLRGALRTVPVGDDLSRVLGFTATALVFTRALPGDLPEERPFALDLRTRSVRPLLPQETGHVYNLALIDGRLFFSRTAEEVLTAPGAQQRVEVVERDPATGAERVVAVETGTLPAAFRFAAGALVYTLDPTLSERTVDLSSGAVSTHAVEPIAPPALFAPSPGGDLAMPYVHQVYDTPDDFNGNWACGPTSTLMAVLHFGRLGKWPVHASTPSAHTSDYGAYVAYEYSAFGSTFNRVQNDAGGRAARGGYGWCTDGGGAWAYRMQDYAKRHNLSSDFDGTATFAKLKAAIDAGKVVALSTQLTSAGHIVTIKGYTSDGRLVANDPYGNKNQGYRNYAGENAVYTWAQVGAKWFITVYGTVTPTNKPPGGWLDGAGCDRVWGWAQDPDQPTKAIDVHLYFGGPAGSGAVGKPLNAGRDRSDLCGAIGSCNHAFEQLSPYSLHDGQGHPVHAYGIDSQGGANAELSASPGTLTCPPTPPAGVKRHVSNPEVYGAWKFDAFQDQMPLSDAKLDALPAAQAIAPAPVMIRADGHPEVWILDDGFRRHVPSPEVAASWRLDLGAVQVKPLAEVEGYPVAPPLRGRPLLVKASGAAVYVVDDALPGADAGVAGRDASSPGRDAAVRLDTGGAVVAEADGGEAADAGADPNPGVADGGARIDAGPGAVAVEDAKGGCGCGAGGAGLGPVSVLLGLLALRRRR